MRYIFIILSIFLFGGCKTNLSNIDINDIDAHRAYQDSMFVKAKNINELFSTSRKLIKEYEIFADKAENSSFNYYLARLYSKFTENAFYSQIFDSASQRLLIDSIEMTHFVDSAYFFAEKSLKLDSNNIRSMYILACTISFEEFYLIKSDTRRYHSFTRDLSASDKRINYLVNNAERFINIDNSKEQYLSRGISEVALLIISNSLDGYKYDAKKPIEDNANKLALICGKLYNYINKYKDNVLVNINRPFFDGIMPQYDLLVKEIVDQQEKQKNKDLIKERESQTIKAAELLSQYEDNEVNADANFKDRTFFVEGVVDEIGKDIMNQIYVTLGTDRILSSVQCFVDNGSTAINLRKGMKVTFQGNCTGLMFNVLMKNCVLVENLSDLKKKVKY